MSPSAVEMMRTSITNGPLVGTRHSSHSNRRERFLLITFVVSALPQGGVNIIGSHPARRKTLVPPRAKHQPPSVLSSMHNPPSGGNYISGIRTNMERLSVRRKRRERRIGSVGIVAGLAEPRRRRILLPERGAAAVGENAVAM